MITAYWELIPGYEIIVYCRSLIPWFKQNQVLFRVLNVCTNCCARSVFGHSITYEHIMAVFPLFLIAFVIQSCTKSGQILVCFQTYFSDQHCFYVTGTFSMSVFCRLTLLQFWFTVSMNTDRLFFIQACSYQFT